MAFATCVLAVSTTGLWIFTGLLWKTTARAVTDGEKAIAAANKTVVAANRHADESANLVKVTQDTAERQLRAYVFVENAWVIVMDALAISVDIKYRIKNYGKTPARKVKVSHIGQIVDWPVIGTFNPDEITYFGAMAPDGDYIDNWTPITRPFPWADVGAERKAVGLLGKIEYQDAFGNERWTTFCFFATGKFPVDGEMDVHEEGNDYH